MNWRQDTTLSDPEQACMWDSEYKAAQVSRTDFSNADQHPYPLEGQTPRIGPMALIGRFYHTIHQSS